MKEFLLILFLSTSIFSQTKDKLIVNLNFTQSAFDNWSKGGEDSYSWQGLLNYAGYLNYEKFNFTNKAKLSYGQVELAEQGTRKTTDEINLESIMNMNLAKKFNPFVSVQFQTQFTKGFKYPKEKGGKIDTVSSFMDPGYFFQSIGYSYKNDSNTVNVRLGLSFKETVTDKYTSYTDDPNTPEIEKIKTETGFKLDVEYQDNISEKINLSSKLTVFSTLDALNTSDFTFDTTLSSQVSNFVNVSFNFLLVYDTDLKAATTDEFKRQIKRFLSVGLTYNFL